MGVCSLIYPNSLFTYLQKKTGNGLLRLSGITASGTAHRGKCRLPLSPQPRLLAFRMYRLIQYLP